MMATTENTYRQIRDALAKVCLASGRYERGGTHEPTSAPGSGLTFAIFAGSERPITSSGLNSTSTLMIWTIQSRLSITYKPQDDIDLKLGNATRDLCQRLSQNYDLDVDGVRSIDVRGINGVPLSWESGYLNQDNKWFRVFGLQVPLIINDAWPEVE
jgi:hypothetical protein